MDLKNRLYKYKELNWKNKKKLHKYKYWIEYISNYWILLQSACHSLRIQRMTEALKWSVRFAVRAQFPISRVRNSSLVHNRHLVHGFTTTLLNYSLDIHRGLLSLAGYWKYVWLKRGTTLLQHSYGKLWQLKTIHDAWVYEKVWLKPVKRVSGKC